MRQDDGYTVLRAMCSGFEPKEIAAHLIDKKFHDGKSIDQVAAYVRDCLNPNRQQYFKMSEIISISQFTGNPDALHLFEDAMGYSRSYPLDTGQQLHELKEMLGHVLTTVSVIGNRIQELEISPEDKKVTQLHPQKQAVRFCKQANKVF